MRAPQFSRRVGGTVGLALLLSTAVWMGPSTRFVPAASASSPGAAMPAPEARVIAEDRHQEELQLAKLKADVTRVQADLRRLPPEINGARLYAGPGASPMLAASGAWSALSTELEATMDSYQSVIAELGTGDWTGPASTSMSAAANAYVSWLKEASQQAEQAASQAQAAAAAFEASTKGK